MVRRRPAGTYPARVSSGFSTRARGAGAAGGGAKAGPASGSAGEARRPEIDAARLRVAVLRLSRRLRKHDLGGLTPSQLSTLSCVGKTGPVRLGDLAAAERIAPSTLTRLVNVLEDRGYLLRQPAPGDARAFLVTLKRPATRCLIASARKPPACSPTWCGHCRPMSWPRWKPRCPRWSSSPVLADPAARHAVR